MINLTPHTIRVMNPETGEVVELPPAGVVARVSTTEEVVGSVTIGTMVVPVMRKVFGEVVGLPEDGQPCIVSGMVAAAVPGRAGVEPDLSLNYSSDAAAIANVLVKASGLNSRPSCPSSAKTGRNDTVMMRSEKKSAGPTS